MSAGKVWAFEHWRRHIGRKIMLNAKKELALRHTGEQKNKMVLFDDQRRVGVVAKYAKLLSATPLGH